MAYTPKPLSTWVTDNPSYNAFPGTVSGKPIVYTSATTAESLTTDAADYFVWDWATGLPELSQSPSNADITSTGKTVREVLATVPDAPASSELTVNLGADTDAAIDALQGIVTAYQTAIAAGKKFYLVNFMGIGKKSEVYEASVAWSSGIQGEFPDPLTTTLSVTPNLGGFHDFMVITNTVSG